MFWIISSTILFATMAVFMIFVRLKAAKKPVSVKKIILPPIMMSTGMFMFIFPVFQVEWLQVGEALLVGILCSIFLIKTSKFEIRDKDIYLIPSRAFPFILFGLLLFRLVVKLILGSYISFGETSGMFFLLALGMIVTWRVTMLYQFLQLKKTIPEEKHA
ncbi:CcdC family protein [Oceanobacillus halophilus]|uniref:Cytochrome c biogenesis protein CcdC n=1 Tax=Oceanobacillus halophilus TaxID=930130 RepID=A0A495ACN0_9BACI|nr:cytochrome c biogenesis protein CcdC [Oceanobacillus halophilus]RKQ37573.1 cytochrome c biogenesis protein CcdC [Oceanobacillus halophilus]